MTVVQRRIDAGCGCDAPARRGDTISLDQALRRIAGQVLCVDGVERVDLAQASGRVLAAPIRALADMPRFDHAAVDGYALRWSDLTGAGPWTLAVALRCAAGDGGHTALPPGACARILTGAPVPQGADCVVMQEAVARGPDGIVLRARPDPGANIRRRAEEYSRGADIVPPGLRIGPRGIAAAASAGHGDLVVRRRLRLALLVSGAEIAPPGAPRPGRAGIWDVNTPMLRAALARPDLDLRIVDHLPDDIAATRQALGRAAQDCDLVVTTGGVSVGEEDHLRAAVRDLGGREIFAGVAIKPGKPVAFGRLGGALWLGLPGNPQSAFVTWALFGEPILAGLSGCAGADRPGHRARLSHPVRRRPGRCELRPARVVGWDATGRARVEAAAPVRSGQVGLLALSDGLVVLPARDGDLAAGALVDFLPFRSERGHG
ncbi:MAG: molybdopterin molybdotransferase [Rhodobacteraceae bacterium HLUCCA08]|nr:MAG: molybdopterin molybdotransferase [Rhodobacteraceae bacterium HLUCCA08]